MGSYRRWGATWEARLLFIFLFHLPFFVSMSRGLPQFEHLLWVRPAEFSTVPCGVRLPLSASRSVLPEDEWRFMFVGWEHDTTRDQLEVSGQFLPFRV